MDAYKVFVVLALTALVCELIYWVPLIIHWVRLWLK